MKRRRVVFTAALLILLLAGSEAYGAKATTLLNVRATILPHLTYMILREPAALEITKENSKDNDKDHHRNKKYKKKKDMTLEVENETILSVDTNTTNGYILSVQSLASNVFILVKIKVEGNGPKFKLAPGDIAEAHIPYSGKSHDVITLSYKFYLSQGVEPGLYPWPIIVTVHSL